MEQRLGAKFYIRNIYVKKIYKKSWGLNVEIKPTLAQITNSNYKGKQLKAS